jgi:hypothetical protein
MATKTTIWEKKKITIFIGGDPAKNQPPYITIEMDNPQFQFDQDKNVVYIIETRR